MLKKTILLTFISLCLVGCTPTLDKKFSDSNKKQLASELLTSDKVTQEDRDYLFEYILYQSGRMEEGTGIPGGFEEFA